MPSTLPVELVSAILAFSARDCRVHHPAWTASLLALSSATYDSLLREIYYLFVVWLPDELDALHTPSYVAFVSMLCNPGDARRHVIRHLAFQTLHGRSVQHGGLPYIPNSTGTWELETIVGDIGLLYDLAERGLAGRVLQPKFIATSELTIYRNPGNMPPQNIGQNPRISALRAWQRQSNMTDFISGTLRSQEAWVSVEKIGIALSVPRRSTDGGQVAHLWQMALCGLQLVQRGTVHLCLHVEVAKLAAQAAEGICEALRTCKTDVKIVISFKIIGFPAEWTLATQIHALGWRPRGSLATAPQTVSYDENNNLEGCQNIFLATCLAAGRGVGDDVLARICFADATDTVIGAISLQTPELVYRAILDNFPTTPVDIKPLVAA